MASTLLLLVLVRSADLEMPTVEPAAPVAVETLAAEYPPAAEPAPAVEDVTIEPCAPPAYYEMLERNSYYRIFHDPYARRRCDYPCCPCMCSKRARRHRKWVKLLGIGGYPISGW